MLGWRIGCWAGKHSSASRTMLEPSELVGEKTLAIVKPDAVRKDVVQEILHRIVSAGFQVAARAQVQLTEVRVGAKRKKRYIHIYIVQYM